MDPDLEMIQLERSSTTARRMPVIGARHEEEVQEGGHAARGTTRSAWWSRTPGRMEVGGGGGSGNRQEHRASGGGQLKVRGLDLRPAGCSKAGASYTLYQAGHGKDSQVYLVTAATSDDDSMKEEELGAGQPVPGGLPDVESSSRPGPSGRDSPGCCEEPYPGRSKPDRRPQRLLESASRRRMIPQASLIKEGEGRGNGQPEGGGGQEGRQLPVERSTSGATTARRRAIPAK